MSVLCMRVHGTEQWHCCERLAGSWGSMSIEINSLKKPECRVLQVFGNLGTGGAETWLIAVLRYLKKIESELPVRISIHIFITNGIRSDFDDEAVRLGATLHYSKYSRRNLISFMIDWRRVLHQYNFDVIHDQQENTAGLHFLMGLGYLPAVRIAHLHNPIIHLQRYSKGFLRSAILWTGRFLISKLGTHILSTSSQLISEQGYFSAEFDSLERKAVYCGFDTSRFLGDNEAHCKSLCDEFNFPYGTRIILFVGRLDSVDSDVLNQKNPAFALEIGRLSLQKDLSLRMLVVGGGESVRKRLEDRVKSWGLADRILLLGQRPDVPRFMLGSHLFLLTSIAEGLGMVVVEAQAAGLPSIVSDTTPKECVVDNAMVDFLSLEQGSEIWSEMVLNKIRKPRLDSYSVNELVKNSDFSIEKSVEKLIQIYTQNIEFKHS